MNQYKEAKTQPLKNVTNDQAVMGAVIAQIREISGMSREDFAKKVNIKPLSLSRIEKGETTLTAYQLRSIAREIGFTANLIFDLVDQAERELRAKGIDTKSAEELKAKLKNSDGNSVVSGAAIAGFASAGMMPVVGTLLFGLVGGIVGAGISTMLKKQGSQEKG